jgi:peptidoglycan hydrolase-like protein with peptidoglycan-binding domain
MYTLMVVLIVSVLWLCPIGIEAGTPGTTGEQRPEQPELLSKDNVKLVQERLKAEGVYAGPLDGELNEQTKAALRQYQEKQGIPVSGAVDEETVKQLQLRLPKTPVER